MLPLSFLQAFLISTIVWCISYDLVSVSHVGERRRSGFFGLNRKTPISSNNGTSNVDVPSQRNSLNDGENCIEICQVVQKPQPNKQTDAAGRLCFIGRYYLEKICQNINNVFISYAYRYLVLLLHVHLHVRLYIGYGEYQIRFFV